MKIAVNARFLLPGQLEGIGWYTYEVVSRMVAAHPEDTFYLLFDRPYDERFRFGPNVEMKVVPPPARHPLLWLAWFEWSMPRVLKRLEADVFFSPDNYCSLSAKAPTAMVMHDIAYAHFPKQIPWLSRQYYRHFVPRYLHRADRVLTVSEFTARDLVETLDVSAEKVQVTWNGPRGVFHPLSDAEKQRVRAQYSQGKPYFLYVGAIHPRKNVHRMIRAFDIFKNKTGAPHQLLLAGRWAWQTGAVRSAYENAEYREAIHFLGYLEDDQLPEVLGGAFALTYVSLWEGFGLPVLEALYADVPVIYADATSLPEVAGPAGIGVDPMSETDIATGMLKLVENEELSADLIAKGRHQRGKFSWEQTAENVYAVLRDLGMGKV